MSGRREGRGSLEVSTALAEALTSSEAEERRRATSRVVELDTKKALPLLLTGLRDGDWRVRKEATIAARAFLPDRALIEALIGVLDQGDDVGLRNAAVEVLASAGHAAVEPLANAMSILDGDGRKLAVDTLGRSRDPDALGPLEAALFDPDDNVRQAAVEAIASVGTVAGDPAHKILIRCLSEDDRFVRLAALEGLNHLGAIVPWDRIEPLLEDPTSRAAALSAAALAEHPKAPMALARALVSARGGAFAQAILALARLAEGPIASRVVEALGAQGLELSARLIRTAMSEDEEFEHLRAPALLMAALANAPGVIEVAIKALSEQSLTAAAQRALAILGMNALPALVETIAPAMKGLAAEGDLFASTGAGESEDAAMRAAAIDIAAAIALEATGVSSEPPPDLLRALRLATLDPDKDVASSALYAVSRLGTGADIELVSERALSPVLSIASAAERALTALTSRFSREARAHTAELMKNEASWLPASVMLGALGASGDLDPSEVHAEVAFLANCAMGSDARTRRAAVMAVAEIGGVWANDVLSFALADEERDVQLAAARALGRVCSDLAAGRFMDVGPPSAGAPLSGAVPPPRASATDVLELISRSGDTDLVAVAVNALGNSMTSWNPPSLPPSSRGSSSGQAASIDPPRVGSAAVPRAISAIGMATAVSFPSIRPFRASLIPSDDLIAALSPLAANAPGAVAIAAVDALSRAPAGTPGRLSALLGALQHPEEPVTKAAMLKLEVSDATCDKLSRCLDHSSREIRLLAAELLLGCRLGFVEARLRARATVERDPEVRLAIDRSLALSPMLASAREDGSAREDEAPSS